ncbi:MAG: nicotinate-nucleotide--dimethylbenzimidazole phosphoribosyltransferase [Chitinophagales bacterium]|nr:nicotinate-nucleotide--dimethylbenzimidazole phosphoribosyltransferase [Chitinophagales bacterium]
MSKHEEKYCPRCNAIFECKVDTIHECPCSTIQLTVEERNYIGQKLDDCLCASCMKALKTEYHNNNLKKHQDETLDKKIQHKIDFKTKPIGSLGILERLAKQICRVQNTLNPVLNRPSILVFAADHGIAQSGVSAYPTDVTAQMVLNFINGGAAINVFSKQHHLELKIIDAGVNHDFQKNENLIDAKIAKGTQNFLYANAMTETQLNQCFEKAKSIIDTMADKGCNVIGFGEMGIGNTSAAAMLMSALCNFPLEQCAGKGTRLNEEQFQNKIKILKQAQQNHAAPKDVYEALTFFGGFEIAQICGAMLRSFEKNMLILVDGFIATAAYLCAFNIQPDIKKLAIFCHQSDEQGHQKLLEYLQAKPLLNLNLRLGEGTGCALAFPLIQSAVNFMNEMASFDSAGVSNKSTEI